MLEKRVFNQGMNGDMEDRYIQPGEYRYALNIRAGVSDNENAGVIENVKGNTIVSAPLPSGVNTCIGSHEDKKYKVIYYFIHNDQDRHVILEFDIITNAVREVVASKALNFDLNHLITGVNLIEGEILKWTDDYNEPRSFNVKRTYSTTALSTANIEETISTIKYQPALPPSVRYATNINKLINNLYGSLWQFRYRYVYLDNEKSAWSSISKTPLPKGEDAIHTNDDYNYQTNNCIDITFNTGGPTVKRIEIAARDSNIGKWLLIEQRTHLAGTNTIVNFLFYNDETYIAIDENEANKLYDAVPRLAKSQEIIDGNRLAYGNVLDGFDQVDTDIELSIEEVGSDVGQLLDARAVEFPYKFPLFGRDYVINRGVVAYQYWTSTNPYAPFEGDVISVLVEINQQGDVDGSSVISKIYSHTTSVTETRGDAMTALRDQINNDPIWDIPPDFSASGGGTFRVLVADVGDPSGFAFLRVTIRLEPALLLQSTYPNPNNIQDFLNTHPSIWGFNVPLSTSYKRGGSGDDEYLTPKIGARHKYGIVYTDQAGRLSTTMGATDLDVPFYSSMSNPGPVNVIMDINHQPPEWAHYYHIVYSPSTDVGNYLHVVLGEQTTANGKIYYSLDPSTSDYRLGYPASLVNYSFSKGDRARIVRNPNGQFVQRYIDVEILELTEDNFITFGLLPSGVSITDIREGMMIEIYSPRKVAEEVLYYEIGEAFPILNPRSSTRAHAGDTDQTTSSPARVIIENNGDSYWRRRNIGLIANQSGSVPFNTYDISVEDPSFSDFYESETYHIGRPNVVDLGAEETRRPATIFYSEPFIPNTNINGLSSFFLTNFEEYDRNYGSIQKLYSEDKRLIMFQELKVGQILVNEIVYRDLTGGATVGASQNILSTVIYYSGEFGIGLNPESFGVYANRKYFVDVNRGAVLRLSTDGITVISENMMRNYFNDTFSENIKRGGSPIFGVYDRRFDEYIVSVTFRDFDRNTWGNDDDSETLAFCEPLKKWTSFYSFQPEFMSESIIDIVSWKDGNLYVHNNPNVPYNQFYGEQYSSQIKIISNENPSNIKFYQSIQEESTTPWIMPEGSNQYGQQTNLVDEDFETIEGHHYAAFWKDVNTPNISNPLIEGDHMRSYTMTLLLENNSTELEKLFSVGVRYGLSELSNR